MMNLNRLRMIDTRNKTKEKKEQQKEKQKSQKGKEDQEQDVQMQQVKEKLNIDNANMGDVVTDFYKSDAPQFKGKSKKKRRQMAIAAKLEADGKPLKSESALNPFQYHPDKKGTDKGTPEQAKKIAKNISDNRKKGPMKYDPESDTKGT